MDTGEPLATVRDRVTSANVYLGARPVAEALAGGAQIVLCGRVTDTALALGPLVHEYRLGGGRLGPPRRRHHRRPHHRVRRAVDRRQLLPLLGGARSLERRLPDRRGGRRTAPSSSPSTPAPAGWSTVDTVAEQLVYEMGDPRAYITPDVTADFTSIRLAQQGPDRVARRGDPRPAGHAFPQDLRLLPRRLQGVGAADGVRAARDREGAARGRDRLEAAGARRRVLRRRGPPHRAARRRGRAARHPRRRQPSRPRSCCAWRCATRTEAKVDRFGKEIAPLVTAGPPGVTGFAGGRPKAQEVVAYWPALLAREEVEPRLAVSVEEVLVKVKLARIAHARSGDKGDGSNVGLIADSRELYEVIRREVTAERVKRHFARDLPGRGRALRGPEPARPQLPAP